MTRLRVVEPFQVNYQGKVLGPGQTFDAQGAGPVAGWLRDGWVQEVKAAAAAGRKPRQRK